MITSSTVKVHNFRSDYGVLSASINKILSSKRFFNNIALEIRFSSFYHRTRLALVSFESIPKTILKIMSLTHQSSVRCRLKIALPCHSAFFRRLYIFFAHHVFLDTAVVVNVPLAGSPTTSPALTFHSQDHRRLHQHCSNLSETKKGPPFFC